MNLKQILCIVAFQSSILFTSSQDAESLNGSNCKEESASTTGLKVCPIQECPLNDFCIGERNEKCLCEYFCDYPSCPEGEIIDWGHCYSVDNCTCILDDTTTLEPCSIICENRSDCTSNVDHSLCQCSYECD